MGGFTDVKSEVRATKAFVYGHTISDEAGT